MFIFNQQVLLLEVQNSAIPVTLTVCSYHVRYAFQSESTLSSAVLVLEQSLTLSYTYKMY